jgi:hypothetical protein
VVAGVCGMIGPLPASAGDPCDTGPAWTCPLPADPPGAAGFAPVGVNIWTCAS